MLISEDLAKQTSNTIVDEEGNLRLKTSGKKPVETDHNTISTTIKIKAVKKTRKLKRWNTKDKEGWVKFNERMTNAQTADYSQFEKFIIKSLKSTIGKRTITINKINKIRSKELTKLRRQKRKSRQEFNKACKSNAEDKEEKLQKYQEAQYNLRTEVEAERKKLTLANIRKIRKEGGTKSQRFWKTRNRILGKTSNANYNTISEDDTEITGEEETHNYIADYYENLYQAREAQTKYDEKTKEIIDTVKRIEKELAGKKEPEFTMKEMKTVAKQLKRNKSNGPDDIPNEVFIEANEATLEKFRKIFNNILNNLNIPKEWQTGDITRLYKGKGKKGKCSNERGITRASNMGKFFERLVNNRAMSRVTMSDHQAGGKKGRATEDHIIISTSLNK